MSDPTLFRPRIFLSYARPDRVFIERVERDLRRCRIDPWIDITEIGHGQPWMEAIFQAGIPTCDGLLVYLTPDSIASPMVEREMDAGLLRRLQENEVAFLPYVSDAGLRKDLRVDLQTLQVLAWNISNYKEVLPQVVAEIWRHYLDKVISDAVRRERVGRLEAENELQRLKEERREEAFNGREAADFEFIWSQLDRWEIVELRPVVNGRFDETEAGRRCYRVHLQSLVPILDRIMGAEYDFFGLRHFLRNFFANVLRTAGTGAEGSTDAQMVKQPDLRSDLLMYGFLENSPRRISSQSNPGLQSPYAAVFTQKMFRFKYWLTRRDQLPEDLRWDALEQPDVGER